MRMAMLILTVLFFKLFLDISYIFLSWGGADAVDGRPGANALKGSYKSSDIWKRGKPLKMTVPALPGILPYERF